MNPKLKAAAAAVTKMINQEGALSFEELQALTGMSEMVLSAALNEMITTGIVTQGANRATGNKKYVLTAQALNAKAKKEPKVEAEPVPVPAPEATNQTPQPVQHRAKRLAPNPMVGCFLHNGNIIIKLDRRATNHVSLDVSDAEIFSGLLSSLVEKAKRNAR